MTGRKFFELWEASTPAIINIISIENNEFNSFLSSWKKFNSLNIENSIYIEVSKVFYSIAIDIMFSLKNNSVNSDDMEKSKIFGKLDVLSDSYPEFDSIFRKLAKKLKNLITIPTVALSGLEYVLLDGSELTNNGSKKYLLCTKDLEKVVSIQETLKSFQLDGMCSVSTLKDINAEGTDDIVILLGPISWHKKVLLDPPSKKIVFIQPSFFSNETPVYNIFEYDSFIYGQSPVVTSIDKVIKITLNEEPLINEVGVEKTQEIQNFLTAVLSDRFVNSSDDYIEPMQSMHAKLEVRFESGESITLENDNHLWLINLDGVFEERKITNEFDLSAGEYLIEFLNPEDKTQSVRVFDPENWRETMEIWKQKLRKNISRIAYLESSLKRLGAVSATELNIKNWIKPELCRPKNINDFIAVLRFSGIDSEEEQEKYIELARVVSGGRIFAGKTIQSDRRELAKKQIEKYINENGDYSLDSQFSTNGYEFRLKKISM